MLSNIQPKSWRIERKECLANDFLIQPEYIEVTQEIIKNNNMVPLTADIMFAN